MSLASLLAEQGHTPPAQAPIVRKNAGNTGKAFEKELERTCGAYNSQRVARLQKVDPPVRIIRYMDKEKGKLVERIIFLQNPFLDIMGCWTARGGRTILVEAKSTSTHRLPFNNDAGFKSAQFAAMKSWMWGGAATALLWQFNGKVTLWTVEMLMREQAAAAKSLKHENGINVPAGVGSVIWDFLAILEQHTP